MGKKYYRWHNQRAGGLKEIRARDLRDSRPDRVLYNAVNGMLSKNRSRKFRMERLKLFAGPEHPHAAQRPEVFQVLRTKNEDLHAPWGLVPEYYLDFTKKEDETGKQVWHLEARAKEFTKSEIKMVKEAKKKGEMGKSKRKTPHPDGYERAGFPRPGKKF